MSATSACVPLLHIGFQIAESNCKFDVTELGETLAEKTLTWAVQHFSNNNGIKEEIGEIFSRLQSLIKQISCLKAHFVEPVLMTILQNRLHDVLAIDFAKSLLLGVSLKPLFVNRCIQTVVQHRHFDKICREGNADLNESRNKVIQILYSLFNLHPSNTCQSSHISPLVKVYKGTTSYADRSILAIFQLFEATRNGSVSAIFGQWSPSADDISANSLEALKEIDPVLTLWTCQHFPDDRTFGQDPPASPLSEGSSHIYDPVFILVLFSHMMSQCPPDSALSWVQLMRTNVVSLLIRCLSSKDVTVRSMAFMQLSLLWEYLGDADMQEWIHVVYILTQIKNLFPPGPTFVPRIPTYASLLLLHAFRGVFHPSSFTYPLTSKFLLQRPELDTFDVPLLLGMLYSSDATNNEWKKERGWIIRFLADGMTSSVSWKVLKRRHTWDLVSSLFQSSHGDMTLRGGILDILASLSCNKQAATSLILKSGLLTWIEMQLLQERQRDDASGRNLEEQTAWLKILENLLVSLDTVKMDVATNFAWRVEICECLMLVIDSPVADLSFLRLIIKVSLRLTLLPGNPPCHRARVSTLIDTLVSKLEEYQPSFDIYTPLGRFHGESMSSPPHRNLTLSPLPLQDPIWAWGISIESLWRMAMTVTMKPNCWGELITRLLWWRAAVGSSRSPIGEWVRTEVVRNLTA